MMDEDSRLVKVTRVATVTLGVAIMVLGVVILEGGLLSSMFSTWGWLFNAAVGGGTMGLGLGLGAAGVTGEWGFLERLRGRAGQAGEISEGEGGKPLPRPGEDGLAESEEETP